MVAMSDEKKSTTTTKKAGETAGKSQTKPAQVEASTEFVEAQERGYFGEMPKGAKDGK